MKKAIYIGDLRYHPLPVFELNEITNNYEMIEDKEILYSKEIVEVDEDFILFTIVDNRVSISPEWVKLMGEK